jgi:4-alpha-glucanotransferase
MSDTVKKYYFDAGAVVATLTTTTGVDNVPESILSFKYTPVTLPSGQVLSTGIVDDFTAEGAPWFADRLSIKQIVIDAGITRIGAYAFQGCSNVENLIYFAFNSIANLVIIPLQDYLELTNEEGRMNTPSTAEGNWVWRVKKESINQELINKIKKITIQTNRD